MCFELHAHALVLGRKGRVGNLGWFGHRFSCNHFLGIYTAWTLDSQKDLQWSWYTIRKYMLYHALYNYTSDKKILKRAEPQNVPTNMQKASKDNLSSLNRYAFAGQRSTHVVWLGPSPLELPNVADRSPPGVISGDKGPYVRDQIAKHGLYKRWFYMYCTWIN